MRNEDMVIKNRYLSECLPIYYSRTSDNLKKTPVEDFIVFDYNWHEAVELIYVGQARSASQ